MMTFLGLIVLIAGLAVFVFARMEKNSATPSWIKSFKKRHATALLVVGVTLMLIKYIFFFVDRGFNYLLVSPTGRMSAVMEQGIKWRGFAKKLINGKNLSM